MVSIYYPTRNRQPCFERNIILNREQSQETRGGWFMKELHKGDQNRETDQN